MTDDITLADFPETFDDVDDAVVPERRRTEDVLSLAQALARTYARRRRTDRKGNPHTV